MQRTELIQRLRLLDTACVCDAEKGLQVGLRVMDPGIRPIRSGLKLVGTAHTVCCHEDFLTVIQALHDAKPGEVIVIDSQTSRKALYGELFATEAKRKGLAGIVNDGACRDTALLAALEIPCYSRSIHPAAGTTSQLFETQIPILCGGATVSPGDVLFGDDDGIIVATTDQLGKLIPLAEEIQRTEERVLRRMAEGVSLLDMLNFEEHSAAVGKSEESALAFDPD